MSVTDITVVLKVIFWEIQSKEIRELVSYPCFLRSYSIYTVGSVGFDFVTNAAKTKTPIWSIDKKIIMNIKKTPSVSDCSMYKLKSATNNTVRL